MRVPFIPYMQGLNDYTDGDKIKYGLAFHNTSNDASDTAEADWATRRPDGTSAHVYVDGDSATQSVDTDDKTGHAGSAQGNENAISFELTGANGWTRQQWLANIEWNLLGRVAAAIIRHHWPDGSFQVRRVSVAEMKANPKIKAIYGHDDMRLAWGGTTHTDPGPGFPWDHLVAVIKAALNQTGENGMAWEPKAHEIVNLVLNGSSDKGYVTGDEARDAEAGSTTIAHTVNLRTVMHKLDLLLARPTASVDVEALATSLAAKLPQGQIPPTAQQIAEAVADEERDRMQD
jgi:N-acetyl-anhydromuramyl-L-alanine amidase AmpD